MRHQHQPGALSWMQSSEPQPRPTEPEAVGGAGPRSQCVDQLSRWRMYAIGGCCGSKKQGCGCWFAWLPLMAQQRKNRSAMQVTQETRVRSLGREDLLEEEVAPHSSIRAWKTPRTEEPGVLQSKGSQRVGHDWSDLACPLSAVLEQTLDVLWQRE